MFKKTMFVVGALVAATMSMPGTARAAPYRSAYVHRVRVAARAAHRPRVAAFRTVYRTRPARARFAAARYAPARYGASRNGASRNPWAHSRLGRGYAWRRPAFRRAVAASTAPASPLATPASPFAALTAPVAALAAPVVAATRGVVRSGVQLGRASFYSGPGRTAAGGHVGAATCAHRSLPFGTRVLVTNLANAHQAVLTVNDRGPFVGGRVIDVSVGAAGVLGMLHSGTAPVRVQVVGGPG